MENQEIIHPFIYCGKNWREKPIFFDENAKTKITKPLCPIDDNKTEDNNSCTNTTSHESEMNQVPQQTITAENQSPDNQNHGDAEQQYPIQKPSVDSYFNNNNQQCLPGYFGGIQYFNPFDQVSSTSSSQPSGMDGYNSENPFLPASKEIIRPSQKAIDDAYVNSKETDAKTRAEIMKTSVKSTARIEEHRAKKEIDEDSELRMNTAHPEVYYSKEAGFEYYYDKGSGRHEIKPLLFIPNMVSTLYFALSGDGRKECLCLSWHEGESVNSIYIDLQTPFDAKLFYDTLSKNGKKLKVSQRKMYEVIYVLFAKCIEIARERELPDHHGWNILSNGDWYYAFPEEPTIKDLLNKSNQKG